MYELGNLILRRWGVGEDLLAMELSWLGKSLFSIHARSGRERYDIGDECVCLIEGTRPSSSGCSMETCNCYASALCMTAVM